MKLISKIIQYYKEKDLEEIKLIDKIANTLTTDEFARLYRMINFKKKKTLEIMFSKLEDTE